jgi:hypothetical protein
MSKWWVDPTYDPMQELHDCKTEINNIGGFLNQLANGINAHDELLVELTNQNRKLLQLYQSSQQEIQHLTEEIQIMHELRHLED